MPGRGPLSEPNGLRGEILGVIGLEVAQCAAVITGVAMDADIPARTAIEDVTRVFVLDDHEVVRCGLRDLLDCEPDLTVVGEAATAEQAIARGPALRPDVAVLDVRLRDGDGIGVCRELRSRLPDLACLMLTSFDEEDALLDSIMAGAAGYVLKDIRGTDLVAAVRTVATGQSMLDPATTAHLMRSLRSPAEAHCGQDERLSVLSDREKAVLELIGEGLTNRQISKRLYLSEKTVKNHISRLLAKLGVERRVQAAVIATQVHEQSQQH
ncbi:response regulator transcription factor [Kitasatospora cinereorecta]